MRTMPDLYGVSPFDPNDRRDVLADTARKAVLEATKRVFDEMRIESGDDLSALGSGLMVGFVSVLRAMAVQGDATDAAIRATILQLAPWAVDMARSMDGLDPLPGVA